MIIKVFKLYAAASIEKETWNHKYNFKAQMRIMAQNYLLPLIFSK
jgi:hypothetical protein